MPADHLTADADTILHAVRAVLAGQDPSSAAAATGLDPEDLRDAAEAYHAAGTAALEHRAASRWHHVNIRFPDPQSAERSMATFVGPRFDELEAAGQVACWWFMRKPPGCRIRLRDADTAAVGRLLSDLATSQVITSWRPALYEPEAASFGGTAGMDAAHALFCADSRGVLDYLRRDPPTGRRELSILLIAAMLTAARLDSFERGDVFGRVAAMRPSPPDGASDKMTQLTRQLRSLATVPTDALVAADELATLGASWLGAFREAGRLLAEAAGRGDLSRGLRAVLAHVVIFHWNRLGLRASTQGILASAARTAYLPEDLPVCGRNGNPGAAGSRTAG
jgi:thiopeptide-type bacteriocin biosynthesis protein